MRIKILALGLICLFLILFPCCETSTTPDATTTTTTTTSTTTTTATTTTTTTTVPTTTTTTTTTTTLPAVVTPGEWTATTDFGSFDFIVSSDSNSITEITYNFSNWSCGGVPISGSVSVSQDPPWPISNLSFEIANYIDPSKNVGLTIKGTFSASGDQASGSWEATVYGTICSGSWEGSPK